MAIVIGTTSRQLEWMARWTWAGVVLLGMLTWWWPGYRAWGAMSIGLLGVLAIWLFWKMVAGERTLPGHPLYVSLLVPSAILVYHLAATGLGTEAIGPADLGGGINMSVVFHLGLFSLGVMLSQSLLKGAAEHEGVLSVVGAAMYGGVTGALLWGHVGQVEEALTLLGYSGLGVWLTPLWAPPAQQQQAQGLLRRVLRIGRVAAAVGGAAVLAVRMPHVAGVAMGMTGLVLVVTAMFFREVRRGALVAGAGILAGAAGLMALTGLPATLSFQGLKQVSAIGQGEQAFVHIGAGDSGLQVLAGMIGYVGIACLALGLIVTVLVMLYRSRDIPGQSQGRHGRSIVWLAATGLAMLAMLWKAGFFLPAVTLAVSFTWGLLPAMMGRPSRPRHGLFLLGALTAIMLLLGLAKRDGLVFISARAFGLGDSFLHGMTGLLLAMTCAWLVGDKRLGWVLTVLALAGAAGGLGELAQGMVSIRNMQLTDWGAHAVGSLLAVGPYLLSRGARLCESPDALAKKQAMEAYLR